MFSKLTQHIHKHTTHPPTATPIYKSLASLWTNSVFSAIQMMRRVGGAAEGGGECGWGMQKGQQKGVGCVGGAAEGGGECGWACRGDYRDSPLATQLAQ